MSMSHGVNKKAHTIVSPNPPPQPLPPPNKFSIVYQPFFCSDLTDYCKNKAFPK